MFDMRSLILVFIFLGGCSVQYSHKVAVVVGGIKVTPQRVEVDKLATQHELQFSRGRLRGG